MNRRGSPPPKLSPFFPFFLSLLSSKKKRATTSRETTEEVRSRRASRARDPTATHTRARVFLRQRRRCCSILILDGVPNFFCRFCRSTETPSLYTLFRRASRHKKKGVSTCGAFCVFFLPFFSFFCQNSIIFLPHKNPSSPTLFGHARVTTNEGPSLSFSLSLSLWGSLSLSLARKRREERTRARSESNTASRIFSRAGGRCIRARALVGKPSPSFVRANPKEVGLLVSRGTRRRGKERKEGFCNRSLSCARAVVAHGLSIYSSIDRSIGKEEQKWTRLCSRRLLESRRSEEKIKTGGRTRRTPKTPPTCPKASRYY